MKLIIQIALLLIIGKTVCGQDTENTELFILTINGQDYIVKSEKDFRMTSSFDKPIISIRRAELLEFKNSFIEFYYPSNLVLTERMDFGFQQWVLKEGNFTCLIRSYEGELGGDQVAEQVLSLQGFKYVKDEMGNLQLGNNQLKGKKYFDDQGGLVEVYRLPSSSGKSHFISFISKKNTSKRDQVVGFISESIVLMR